MEQNLEAEIFELISHGGNARAIAYDALKAAEEFNFEEAERLIKEAEEELNLAHNTQTKLITAEINGDNLQISLLMIHAQDHLMTAISEQKLIEHMIAIIKKLKQQ